MGGAQQPKDCSRVTCTVCMQAANVRPGSHKPPGPRSSLLQPMYGFCLPYYKLGALSWLSLQAADCVAVHSIACRAGWDVVRMRALPQPSAAFPLRDPCFFVPAGSLVTLMRTVCNK